MRESVGSEHTGGGSSRVIEGEKILGRTFLRNAWYVAGWASEFERSTPVGRTIVNEPVVLYRKPDGFLVVLQDRCAHRWAPLSLGRVEGQDLRCMYHGIKYGPDGHCVEVPGQERAAQSLCVRAYPVVERHRLVWVWMGDSKRADASAVPDLSMLDQQWRRVYIGGLDYDAHYSLIHDNLLDLSHLSYLHENTLGRPAPSHLRETESKPRIQSGSGAKSLKNGVRVEGWLSGALSRTVVVPKRIPDGDLWSRIDFLVPGIFISHAQMYASGTADACNGLPPQGREQPLSDTMSIQAVTPVMARKTRYYYSIGPRASDMAAEESDAIWAIVQAAFCEDLQLIQAQQRMIDCHPGELMGGIAADRGLVMFRKMMKRFIASEISLPQATDSAPGVPS